MSASAILFSVFLAAADRPPEDLEPLVWIPGVGFRRPGIEQCWDKATGPRPCVSPEPRPCVDLPGCLKPLPVPPEIAIPPFRWEPLPPRWEPPVVVWAPPWQPPWSGPCCRDPDDPPPPPIPLPASLLLLSTAALLLMRFRK
jgi:hypothetical protein